MVLLRTTRALTVTHAGAAAGSRRTVRLAAPVPLIVGAPPAELNCGRAVKSETVCGVANVPAVSNVMVSAAVVAFAWVIASRSVPVPLSAAEVTRKFAGVTRSSRASRRRTARADGRGRRMGAVTGAFTRRVKGRRMGEV